MSRRGPIRLATRGSDLALRQAGEVKAALEDHRFEVELVEVETTGDRVTDELIQNLGKTGAFVRSLDKEVLEGDVDAAVHSLKDVPTEGLEDLAIAAVPERGPPADALVTPDGTRLRNLPPDSVVGTASLRRTAQVLAARPDLVVEPLRGNVDTRVEKLLAPGLQAEHERRSEAESERRANASEKDDTDREDGDDPEFERTVEEWFEDRSEIERRALGREVETEYDAVVLAEAGLRRSGLAHHVETVRLPTDEFVPAAGQGALAVTARDGSETADALSTLLDHSRSRVETTVERVVLREVGGGCIAPVGIHALVQGEHVHVDAQVLSADGDEEVAVARDLPVKDYAAAARELGADLRDRGADDLVAEASREFDDADAPRGDGP